VNESYVYHRPSLIAVRAKICEGPITVISSSVGLHGGGGGGGGMFWITRGSGPLGKNLV